MKEIELSRAKLDRYENVYTLHITFLYRSVMIDRLKTAKRNKKDSQLLIRISSDEREQFLQLCDELDTSAAREIRQFIRGFIKKNAPKDSRSSKETINVEEKQRRRKKGDLAQAGDQ